MFAQVHLQEFFFRKNIQDFSNVCDIEKNQYDNCLFLRNLFDFWNLCKSLQNFVNFVNVEALQESKKVDLINYTNFTGQTCFYLIKRNFTMSQTRSTFATVRQNSVFL